MADSKPSKISLSRPRARGETSRTGRRATIENGSGSISRYGAPDLNTPSRAKSFAAYNTFAVYRITPINHRGRSRRYSANSANSARSPARDDGFVGWESGAFITFANGNPRVSLIRSKRFTENEVGVMPN